MWDADTVVRELRRRGELWSAATGLIGLRGKTLELVAELERALAGIARKECADEWRLPPGIALDTLARADYFASFPQWLTVAAHLGGEPTALEAVATADDPAAAVRRAAPAPAAALPPALCYHAYERYAGATITDERRLTAQGTCWRHEGPATSPLERGWAFTMRELVCVGTDAGVEAFRRSGIDRVIAFASALGLDAEVETAGDPFYAPTARGKALLQQAKGLKHELRLPIGAGRTVAAASFNHHETFFGTAFEIRLPDGGPASSACVAFGLERWLLAFLAAHGPNPEDWPTIPAGCEDAGRRAITTRT